MQYRKYSTIQITSETKSKLYTMQRALQTVKGRGLRSYGDVVDYMMELIRESDRDVYEYYREIIYDKERGRIYELYENKK